MPLRFNTTSTVTSASACVERARSTHSLNRLLPPVALAVSLGGCSAPGTDVELPEYGHLSLGLRSSDGTITYELQGASFHIAGPSEMTIEAPGTDSGDGSVPETLDQELLVGTYSLELLPGWELMAYDGPSPQTLDARLLTPNPQDFEIAPAQTTTVGLQFETAPTPKPDETGSLAIEIEVTQAQQRALVITEFMVNPAALPDADGEWFEVHNTGAVQLDLAGCTVSRDTSTFTINQPLVIAPGDTATFANGEAPGFTPSYVYSGVTLPNSAAFTLSVSCGSELLDSVLVDPGSWPGGAGVAATLSASATNAASNDDAGNWCSATASYNGDLGSPGAHNPSCG